jgi:hypothetical protein
MEQKFPFQENSGLQNIEENSYVNRRYHFGHLDVGGILNRV